MHQRFDSGRSFRRVSLHTSSTVIERSMETPVHTNVYLPPPHPMTALRRTAVSSACQTCRASTNFVCSACSVGVYYCSPQHLLDVMSTLLLPLPPSADHLDLQNWRGHTMQCDAATAMTTGRAMEFARIRSTELANMPKRKDEEFNLPSGCVGEPYRTVESIYADPHRGKHLC